MNNDISEIITFVSNEIAIFRKAWAISGVLDDVTLKKSQGPEDDKSFEHMLKIRLDFLCADSSIPLEIRKAALSFETQEIVGLLERVSHLNSAPIGETRKMIQTKEKFLKKAINSCGEEFFIPNCEKRAVILDRVMRQTLEEQIENRPMRVQKI